MALVALAALCPFFRAVIAAEMACTRWKADIGVSAETSSLAAEAYAIVRQRILRGELILGQVISRRKLAAELGMSFLPVSEALLRLEFEGLLESRPRAGTRVRIPSPEDVRGHYVVREALEFQAAMLFADVATAGERAELRKLAARVDALSQQSTGCFTWAFTRSCTAVSPNAPSATLCVKRSRRRTRSPQSEVCVMRKPAEEDSPRRHQDLAEALTSGGPLKAAEAIREHIGVGMLHVMEVLEPYLRLRKANGQTSPAARGS